MKVNKHIIRIVVLLLVIQSSSCKNRKKVEVTDEKAFIQSTADQVLAVATSDWEYYSAKSKVSLEGDAINKSADAIIKMQKDSVIWISVGLFGIEGARVFMHKDSITFLNKLDRSYMRMAWDEASAYVGTELNLTKTQNLILGNPIIAKDSLFEIDRDSSLYFIKRLTTLNLYKLKCDSFTNDITYSFFRGAKTGKYLELKYAGHQQIKTARVPNYVLLKAKDGLNRFKAEIKLENISLDAFGALPTRVPSSFKRM